MIFLLIFLINQIYAIDDFWVVWGMKSMTRCLELGSSESSCEVASEIIEEQFMETVYPLYTKIGKRGEEVTKKSLDIPYILIGQRVVDKYLNILLHEKSISENDLANKMYWELTLFAMDCIYADEESAWEKVRADEFWQRKEAREYLLSIGVDLEQLQPKESINQNDETKKNNDEIQAQRKKEEEEKDDWKEFELAQQELEL